MSEDKGSCYFCDSVYTTSKSLDKPYPPINKYYIHECKKCKRPYCYKVEYCIGCGDYRGLCKICEIIQNQDVDKWLKVNSKVFEALTGSNTKSTNKN
jgi:sulfur relay (sulfurtransferase) complex TusBCD TusD component (DsrE family)